jgi:hypothetical protein
MQVGPWVCVQNFKSDFMSIIDWTPDQKTKSHVEKAVKQHAPGIKATVHKYNAKQKEMLKE